MLSFYSDWELKDVSSNPGLVFLESVLLLFMSGLMFLIMLL